MNMQMIAVFLSPEAWREVRPNVQGDLNEQNVGDTLKEMFMSEIEDVADYTCVGNPYEGHSLPSNDGIIIACVEGSSRHLGRAIAGNLGFMRDFVSEDSWHGVLFI